MCLLNSNESDTTLTVTLREKCTSTQSNDIDNEHYYRPPTISNHTKSNALTNNLYEACSLGYGINDTWDVKRQRLAAMSWTSNNNKCRVKSLLERKSLWTLWEDASSLARLERYKSSLVDLIDTLRSRNVGRVVVLGDSISDQVVRFLGCDMVRTDGVTVTNNSTTFYRRKGARGQHIDISYQGYQFQLVTPGDADDSCNMTLSSILDALNMSRSEHHNSVFDYTLMTFYCSCLNASVESPTVLMYNAGLHLYSGRKMQHAYIVPTIRAFVAFAKHSRGRVLTLFRETSSQHFNGRQGGNFDAPVVPASASSAGSLCCGSSKESDLLAHKYNWRNRVFHEGFEKRDAGWRAYISWVPFFNTTLALNEFHTEANGAGVFDCTHFIYAPFVMGQLWVDTAAAVKRLL